MYVLCLNYGFKCQFDTKFTNLSLFRYVNVYIEKCNQPDFENFWARDVFVNTFLKCNRTQRQQIYKANHV